METRDTSLSPHFNFKFKGVATPNVSATSALEARRGTFSPVVATQFLQVPGIEIELSQIEDGER